MNRYIKSFHEEKKFLNILEISFPKYLYEENRFSDINILEISFPKYL